MEVEDARSLVEKFSKHEKTANLHNLLVKTRGKYAIRLQEIFHGNIETFGEKTFVFDDWDSWYEAVTEEGPKYRVGTIRKGGTTYNHGTVQVTSTSITWTTASGSNLHFVYGDVDPDEYPVLLDISDPHFEFNFHEPFKFSKDFKQLRRNAKAAKDLQKPTLRFYTAYVEPWSKEINPDDYYITDGESYYELPDHVSFDRLYWKLGYPSNAVDDIYTLGIEEGLTSTMIISEDGWGEGKIFWWVYLNKKGISVPYWADNIDRVVLHEYESGHPIKPVTKTSIRKLLS
jgi:hypothetical protein